MILLEHNKGMSMEQALGVVFNSDTYQKMMNDLQSRCLMRLQAFFLPPSYTSNSEVKTP